MCVLYDKVNQQPPGISRDLPPIPMFDDVNSQDNCSTCKLNLELYYIMKPYEGTDP